MGDIPTLRDQFAMSALNGLLAGDIAGDGDGITGTIVKDRDRVMLSRHAAAYARIAYELADAMLLARKIPCRHCGKPLADGEVWRKTHRECADAENAAADRPELRLVELGGEG